MQRIFVLIFCGVCLSATTASIWAQGTDQPPRLPVGFPAAVRVTVDDAASIEWIIPPTASRRLTASGDTRVPPPPRGSQQIEGRIVSEVNEPSLRISLFVAGDSTFPIPGGQEWVGIIPWEAIRQVDLREDDMGEIRRRGRRGARTLGAIGAVIGALVVPKSRVGGAVGVGLFGAWLGYVGSAQGASVSAAPCWRLIYDRQQAQARVAAGQLPHPGRDGPRVCPGT